LVSIYINVFLRSSKYYSGNFEAKYINVVFLRWTASIKYFIFSNASGAISEFEKSSTF
jgi:hypothetical protein